MYTTLKIPEYSSAQLWHQIKTKMVFHPVFFLNATDFLTPGYVSVIYVPIKVGWFRAPISQCKLFRLVYHHNIGLLCVPNFPCNECHFKHYINIYDMNKNTKSDTNNYLQVADIII